MLTQVLGSKLRMLERVGFTSSLGVFLVKCVPNRTWLCSSVPILLAVSSVLCSITHWYLCRGSGWAGVVDYSSGWLDSSEMENREFFLIRTNCLRHTRLIRYFSWRNLWSCLNFDVFMHSPPQSVSEIASTTTALPFSRRFLRLPFYTIALICLYAALKTPYPRKLLLF